MPPKPRIEFFYDLSSPWTYLAFTHFSPLARRHSLPVEWKPIIVGGVFNAVNMALYETRSNPPVPRKAEYSLKDMQDWAQYLDVTINFPPKCGHPVNAVKVMRACIAIQKKLGDGKLLEFSKVAFEALWRDGKDLGKVEVVKELCDMVGVDSSTVLKEIDSAEVKDALRRNTDEVINRNGFGSPTIYVNTSDMYFGNDRIVLVEAAILRAMGKKAGPGHSFERL